MGPILTEKRAKNKKKNAQRAADPALLLAWYDRHRRVMPWRALAGQMADPYHVWLSEIMLQQTTVATVGPYFVKFLKRWPTLAALAKADLDDVLKMWAGLGYYRRARGLHACARTLVAEHNGIFPRTEKELLKLSGLGPYTAAAIMAIAFDQKANVVDGNVERVMARLHAVTAPLPGVKKKLKELAAANLPDSRFGDYAQALMDLGATVCTPRSPKCALCPWAEDCKARDQGIAADLPARQAPSAKPQRSAYAFVHYDRQGRVLLRQRPAEGLLAGMMEVPSSPWEEGKTLAWGRAQSYAPFEADWRLLDGVVRHTFTHFDLEMHIAVASGNAKGQGRRVAPQAWDDEALPSLMRKILVFAHKRKD